MDMPVIDTPRAGARYELRFESLFNAGRAYVFPCDATGHVDIGRLSSAARRNFLHAMAVVGVDLTFPQVSPQ